jgi:HEAT repeat protein
MTEIRHELQRLIALNYAEQWVPHHIALNELERHGDRLIPGLIECLGDDDAEVRLLAVALLDEAGQRAEPAVAALIQSVADTDRLVRVAAAQCLAKFGEEAVGAVPHLLPWLHDEHEYIRIVAAVTILDLDPTKRDELMPMILAARGSGNVMVRELAEIV